MSIAPPDAINLGLGEIRLPLPACLKNIAQKIISEENLFYTPNAGLPELRQVIAQYYHLDSGDAVCVTVGAEEAIFAALFAYLNPGDEVVLADPSFLAYKTIIQMLKAKPVFFDLAAENDFRFSQISFETAITSQTKIVLLNNPINPTGTCYNNEDLAFIADFCRGKNILLIVDEVYRELFIGKPLPSILEFTSNALVISSLSKSHCLSGYRLGWLASHNPKLLEPIIKVHQYLCTCTSTLSQKIAITAFSEEGKKAVQSIKKYLDTNRNLALLLLDRKKIMPNQAHPYIFISVEDDVKTVEKLLKQKVIAIPGSAFGRNGKNWIRINYGVETALLQQALPKIRENI